jgi:hypothetical protein
MFYNEKLLYDSELIVLASTTSKNYIGTTDLVPVIFNNGSKIWQRHKNWMKEI